MSGRHRSRTGGRSRSRSRATEKTDSDEGGLGPEGVPSFSLGGQYDGTYDRDGNPVVVGPTGRDEYKYYLYYCIAWTVMCITILPVVMFVKKYIDRYPNSPPTDQKQLFNTAQYLYGSGIFVMVFGVFYVPGTYILTKKRILRYNVPDAMEVAQITLVGKFGKSRMSLFAEVLLTWLVFLSALGCTLYVGLNGATFMTDKNARGERLRQDCTKDTNQFCQENKDIMASLIASSLTSFAAASIILCLWRRRVKAEEDIGDGEGGGGRDDDDASVDGAYYAAPQGGRGRGGSHGGRGRGGGRGGRSPSPGGYPRRPEPSYGGGGRHYEDRGRTEDGTVAGALMTDIAEIARDCDCLKFSSGLKLHLFRFKLPSDT